MLSASLQKTDIQIETSRQVEIFLWQKSPLDVVVCSRAVTFDLSSYTKCRPTAAIRTEAVKKLNGEHGRDLEGLLSQTILQGGRGESHTENFSIPP